MHIQDIRFAGAVAACSVLVAASTVFAQPVRVELDGDFDFEFDIDGTPSTSLGTRMKQSAVNQNEEEIDEIIEEQEEGFGNDLGKIVVWDPTDGHNLLPELPLDPGGSTSGAGFRLFNLVMTSMPDQGDPSLFRRTLSMDIAATDGGGETSTSSAVFIITMEDLVIDERSVWTLGGDVVFAFASGDTWTILSGSTLGLTINVPTPAAALLLGPVVSRRRRR